MLNSYNLFLDDIRMPQDAYIYPRRNEKGVILIGANLEEISGIPRGNWEIVRSYDEFVAMIETKGLPSVVSFDHDLHPEHMKHYFAETSKTGIIDYSKFLVKTGKDCAQYFVDTVKKLGYSQKPKTFVHSANQWGKAEILKILKTLQ